MWCCIVCVTKYYGYIIICVIFSRAGKTVVLVHRMVHDWLSRQASSMPFYQLFVCRSGVLLEEVRKAFYVRHEDIGSTMQDSSLRDHTHFRTLSRFLEIMEGRITLFFGPSPREYIPSKRVDYKVFRDVFFVPFMESQAAKKRLKFEPLIVWTQIQTHIKGSCEAVQDALQAGISGGAERVSVTLEKYLSFSRDRVPLSDEKRRGLYDLFRHYTFFLEEHEMWDDCDRNVDMLLRSRMDPTKGYSGRDDMPYSKVYVDEIQDSTQAEILLFFLAVGNNPKAMFFAGDPAQAIVEGVSFRFEEIRSILYATRNADKNEEIAKVQTMKRNFRSHSGILKCAAEVLSLLFSMFPASFRVIAKDEGLCKGPRPEFIRDYMHRSSSLLKEILSRNDKYTLLCHEDELCADGFSPDCSFSDCIDASNMPDVCTIRDSKGMEYDRVIIVNFFYRLPASDQKQWKRRLRHDSSLPEQEEHFPQMETQLKLLYTAITRCCQNLIFVETKESLSGVAFFNWLNTKELAEETTAVHAEEEYRTSDEWRVEGIKSMIAAQGDSGGITMGHLTRAIKCFGRSGAHADNLMTRAVTQQNVEVMKEYLFERIMEGDEELSVTDQNETMNLVMKCLDNALPQQAYDLCKLIRPHIGGSAYYQSLFEKQVVEKLAPT